MKFSIATLLCAIAASPTADAFGVPHPRGPCTLSSKTAVCTTTTQLSASNPYEFDVVGSDENKAKSQKKTNTKKSALEPLAPPSAPERAAPDAVKGKKEKQIKNTSKTPKPVSEPTLVDNGPVLKKKIEKKGKPKKSDPGSTPSAPESVQIEETTKSKGKKQKKKIKDEPAQAVPDTATDPKIKKVKAKKDVSSKPASVGVSKPDIKLPIPTIDISDPSELLKIVPGGPVGAAAVAASPIVALVAGRAALSKTLEARTKNQIIEEQRIAFEATEARRVAKKGWKVEDVDLSGLIKAGVSTSIS